jgi:hypothetical protein
MATATISAAAKARSRMGNRIIVLSLECGRLPLTLESHLWPCDDPNPYPAIPQRTVRPSKSVGDGARVRHDHSWIAQVKRVGRQRNSDSRSGSNPRSGAYNQGARVHDRRLRLDNRGKSAATDTRSRSAPVLVGIAKRPSHGEKISAGSPISPKVGMSGATAKRILFVIA